MRNYGNKIDVEGSELQYREDHQGKKEDREDSQGKYREREKRIKRGVKEGKEDK